MKKILLGIPLLIFVTATVFYFSKNNSPDLKQKNQFPKPTNTIIHQGEDEGDNQTKREAWFERMHRTAPGTNWRAIERETEFQRNDERIRAGHFGVNQRSGGLESIAGGKLTGTWKERGSLNQAGSVLNTEYVASTDKIWLISGGGTLFKGGREGSNWEVINQNVQFSGGLLKFVSTDEGRRLLAPIGRLPHYSDDDGLTWTASTGIPIADGWGNIRDAIVLEDSLNTIYTLSKPDYWADIKLYKSVDKGESFQEIHNFGTNDFNQFKLVKPHHSNEVYLAERGNTTTLYQINSTTDELEQLSTSDEFLFINSRANLTATKVDDETIFYAYNSDNEVWKTADFGITWEYRGTMESSPWSVGLYVSPSDSAVLFMGEVNCSRSMDGGQTWQLVNEWWEYYDNVENKLHADIMLFNECQTADGEDFLLVSNHGGLNVSYNDLYYLTNLGLEGLNVSQYYSVKSSPLNPYYVFAGTQDQGFQIGDVYGTDIANFDQIISGDYGHIVFSNNNIDLWTVYPGGSVSFYRNAINGQLTSWYELESDDESVWLPPLMESPDESEEAIYMAGGNMNGGEGSYLIKLTSPSNNEIQATQFDFDFKSNSINGVLTAIEYSPLNDQKFFAATSNGRFFYSEDEGENWEQSLNFVNEGHYLYGQTIYASKIEEDVVYLGGSGYSNPAVFRSTNGGQSFAPFSEGLPNTLVFEITSNADETMLFAATEAGPYVYLFDEQQWFSMAGLCAPSQTYWSVEYIELLNTVRFATYGRGAWDFEIGSFTDAKEEIIATNNFHVYPNPSTGVFTLEINGLAKNNTTIQVHDLTGKLVWEKTFSSFNPTLKEAIDLTKLEKGSYVLSFEKEGKTSSKMIQIL